MSLENVGNTYFTAANQTAINNAIKTISSIVTPIAPNFTETERKKYGSINEQNKLIVGKVKDYHDKQPELQSPDVDWTEFENDFANRNFVEGAINTLNSIVRMLEDFKIAHDFDNLADALTDYSYTQYKVSTNTAGFKEKYNDLKQFFNKTSLKEKSNKEN